MVSIKVMASQYEVLDAHPLWAHLLQAHPLQTYSRYCPTDTDLFGLVLNNLYYPSTVMLIIYLHDMYVFTYLFVVYESFLFCGAR